ncbi:MAG: response regulator SirA, partial [Dehalococcoidia bacterium]
PEWEKSIWGPDKTAARGPQGERVRPMKKLRNCNVTTVAPTGTISIIAGCSSGIEPLFAVAFMRNQAGVLMPDLNEDFVGIAKAEGWHSEELMVRIAESGHIRHAEVPAKWQRVFTTANEIKPEWHVRMQAAFQDFNDSAISKTCNFANDADEAYVEEIYRLAYKLNCKGVTVYRDGSRDMQVLSTGATAQKVADQAISSGKSEARSDLRVTSTDLVSPTVVAAVSAAEMADLAGEMAEKDAQIARLHKMVVDLEAENLQRRQKRMRPEALKGVVRRLESPLGTMYVTITEDEKGTPMEVFMSLGKAGGALMADVEAIGRLISLALRSGIPITAIHRQLRGISSDKVMGLGQNKVMSVPDAIGIAIEKWMQEKAGVQTELPGLAAPTMDRGPMMEQISHVIAADRQMSMKLNEPQLGGACPDCGSQLEMAEGCAKCHVCGFSECG